MNVTPKSLATGIKGIENMYESVVNYKVDHYLKKIDNAYLHFTALRQEGAKTSSVEISRAMNQLNNVFTEDFSELFLRMAKNNHPNRREILSVGSLYHSYVGNTTQAIDYYKELAEYYKQYGKTAEYNECINVIESLMKAE